MQEIEIDGKDVQQAVESGLRKMGLRRDQVEVAIIDEGSGGFLGLGSRPAKVKIRERRWEEGDKGEPKKKPPKEEPKKEPKEESRRADPGEQHEARGERRDRGGRRGGRDRGRGRREGGRQEGTRRDGGRRDDPRPRPERHAPPENPQEAVEASKSILKDLLDKMGLQTDAIEADWDADQIRVRTDVKTPDHNLLVGKEGRSLEALQFLSTVLVSRKLQVPVAVQVDSEGYWKEKEDKILSRVREAVDEVKSSGEPFRLEPMDPPTRRLVHKALENDPDVQTASEGEGPWRKVVLKPRAK